MTIPSPIPGETPGREELLNAYLDGLLHGPALAEFESLLDRDAELRTAVALQRRIDDSLRREMAQAQPIVPAGLPPQTAGRITGPSRRMKLLVGIAATIVVATGTLYFSRDLITSWLYPTAKPIASREKLKADAWYGKLVDAGFKPDWVCANDEEFANVTRYRLGQALQVRPTPGITVVGWSYRGWILSPNTCTLLATVNGQHVLMLVDRVDEDKKIEFAHPACGLNTFREVQGDLVLYELTPLDKPSLLGICYNPDPPKQ